MDKTLELLDSGQNSHLIPSEINARVQDELTRILSSRTFRAAEREKTFLRYVVEETLQGRGADIKEYTVGVEAFGRGEAFDPRHDTIVRTEARNVRLRLGRYYADEGAADPIRIELPKGRYTALFIEAVPPDPVLSEPVLPCPEIEPAPVSAVSVPAPELAISAAPPEDHPLNPRSPIAFLAAAAAILAVAGLGWLNHQRTLPRTPGGDAASIAVLPFVDLSGDADKEGEILSEGLTEELIDSLARIPRLHVVARSSVFQYKGLAFDIRRIGRELSVRNVLEGSIRNANGHIRITVQLEDTTNGYQLWSQSFDRELDDAITVQGEISTAIVQSLGVQLAGAANLKADAAPSPGAYRDFLRGLYFLNRSTAENIRTSINYFQRAVDVDPDFAPAYVGLSDGYSRIVAFTSTPSREVIPKMRAAASKALELDDTLGEAHLDLARAYTYEWNWNAADREFRRALDLSPSSAAVHRYYGEYLLRIGRLEEALAEARISVEFDPLSPGSAQFAARMLYYKRHYDEGIADLQKDLALNPSSGLLHQALGLAYTARPSTYRLAVAETGRAREMMEGDPWITGQLGLAYALAGQTAQAREILRELESGLRSGSGSEEYVRALPVARVYTGLGDRNAAFLWLQKAVDQRDVGLFLIADPVYDALRDDPRFRSLLQQANLSPAASSGVSMP
jgi:TolB-like protein/tetratricopeptide (TPR) repeat protein